MLMALVVYNLLLLLLSPLLGVFLRWRLSKGKEDRAHWGERWGNLPTEVARDTRRPRIWVHAVSVGEVMAAAPVLRELRRRWPNASILVSNITPGGREVAMKQMPPADEVVYYPLDFPFAVSRALAAARPDVILLMEWEIWPNFLTAAKRRGAKIAVLNGRVSDKGLRRGRRASFFTKPGLDAVDLFAMQSDEDARRAVVVGADQAKIVTLGNTKFDESVTPLTDAERTALRADLGIPPGVPVWVCGSTRPGEEEIIAEALQRWMRPERPDLHLILAPRHIERAEEIIDIFAAEKIEMKRRSRGESGPVLLLDTFGELGRVYAVADVAFIGGSLLPFGGQSVFQPLAQGTPALFGPYMSNQRDIAALAVAEGVGFELCATDAEVLGNEVMTLLEMPPEERAEIAARARALIERNQGVSARCVDAVAGLLGSG
jgi:3-deoxy-D-manno-octulosonic-acid transferase